MIFVTVAHTNFTMKKCTIKYMKLHLAIGLLVTINCNRKPVIQYSPEDVWKKQNKTNTTTNNPEIYHGSGDTGELF